MTHYNKKSLRNDIKKTLMKDIKESFAIIPKANEIKRLLKESEFPYSFEVPFVLEDDLEDIIKQIRAQTEYMPELKDSYMMSFKDNSSTLIIRSKSQIINDALINIINDVQIYGTANQLSSAPLAAQETDENKSTPESEMISAVADVLANSSALCPTCSSANTSLMGESIHFCRDCSSLFESNNMEVKEDKLIDPDKAEDDLGDVLLRKTDKNLEKEELGEDVGMTSGDVATYEIPTKFSKKQKDMFRRGTLK